MTAALVIGGAPVFVGVIVFANGAVARRIDQLHDRPGSRSAPAHARDYLKSLV